jgi:hypothetical protein
MSNPLVKLVQDHAYAREQLEIAEATFRQSMKGIAAEAHAAGVTRYMAQKATGAPVLEVNVWFAGLPHSKPGRRRKNDPVYS